MAMEIPSFKTKSEIFEKKKYLHGKNNELINRLLLPLVSPFVPMQQIYSDSVPCKTYLDDNTIE
jgi:hypothetical protein